MKRLREGLFRCRSVSAAGFVLRFVDTRGMTPEIQHRFEMAVREAKATGEPDHEVVDRCLARLKTMLLYCDEGRPPLEFSDWRELTPPPLERVGPA